MAVDSEASAFRYPTQPLTRRHGPNGYVDFHSYRPWLRDEFSFRCVYCLIREHSPKQLRWRRTWIRIIELAEESDGGLFRELMGYPADLPNLRRSRAPENTRPGGIDDSCFARRERGELPEVYES